MVRVTADQAGKLLFLLIAAIWLGSLAMNCVDYVRSSHTGIDSSGTPGSYKEVWPLG